MSEGRLVSDKHWLYNQVDNWEKWWKYSLVSLAAYSNMRKGRNKSKELLNEKESGLDGF